MTLSVQSLNIPGFGKSERPKLIKKGEYLLEVTGVTPPADLKETKDGDGQLAIQFKVAEDGSEQNKRVSRFFVLSERGMGFLRAMLEDLGVVGEDWDGDDIPMQDIIGKQLYCRVGLRTFNEQESNTIASFRPVTE